MSEDQPSILIVDDQPELIDLYRAFLGDHFDVSAVTNGAEAIERIDNSIDVVTLDRRMPGMSGDQVAEQIQASGLDCGVIILSAVSSSEGTIAAYDEYVEKPVKRDELVSVVNRVLQND